MELVAAAILLSTVLALQAPIPEAHKTPCLVIRPTEGLSTAFGRFGSKYEYMDSFNLPKSKMSYKKKEVEKLQRDGVHIVVVNHSATFHEVQEARESCTAEVK